MKDWLEKLYTTQALTITRLAKVFFGNPDEIEELRRFFDALMKSGVVLKPDVDISKLRLHRAIVAIEGVILKDVNIVNNIRVRGVRSIVPMMPKGILLTIEGGKIDVGSIENPDKVKVYRYDVVYRSRPLRDMLFAVVKRPDSKTILYILKNLDELEPIELPKTKTPIRFDWIDLEILDLVVRNPCITEKGLLKELRERRVGKSIKHFYVRLKRLEKIVTGYGIARILPLKMHGIGLILAIKGRNFEPLMKLLRAPIVMILGYSDTHKEAVVQMITSKRLFHETIKIMDEFCKTHGLELVDFFAFDPEAIIVTRFVRKSTGEYVPQFRITEDRWIPVDVGEVVKGTLASLGVS